MLSQSKTRGLWEAVGLVVRKAEKIKLYRDGTVFGLSLYETEQRRRLWWSILNLDLANSTANDTTSMILLADWDTKLPLNIEDDDILPTSTSVTERNGLTSISHCLWRYWQIEQQRKFLSPDGLRPDGSWLVDRRIPRATRQATIDKVEAGLNEKFLKYCDPVKSLDFTILVIARGSVNFYRRALLCPGPGFKDART